MSEGAELYRLKLSFRRGGGSWGNWEYFEDLAQFEERILHAMIEAAGAEHNGPRPVWLACRDWIEHIFRKPENEPEVTRIYGMDYLKNGEWLPVKARLIPPSIEFDDEENA